METLGSIIKKFQEIERPKKKKKKKNPFISGNKNPKKIVYIFSKETFLIFWEVKTSKKIFIFQEAES